MNREGEGRMKRERNGDKKEGRRTIEELLLKVFNRL